MKPEQLEDLLRYRMEQAHETLREADRFLIRLGWLTGEPAFGGTS